MNNKLLWLGVGLVAFWAGSANAQAPAATPAPAATVHFVQGKAFGLIYPKYRVYANGQLVCRLGRKSHCEVSLPAGPTTFVANTALSKVPVLALGRTPELTLVLEAGKSYYLQGDMAAAGARIPNTTYGLTEVVPNPTKLAQIGEFKLVQAMARPAQ
ncbi:hypothetical protein KBK19_16220 [Microvirga sp. STR05]|uniref:DUF2846 domain-containing protein n=1 Tax=Hymenobacter duratus TaxID=2771356 RepID=A0ABR8JMG6_9BACT|nr:hypothetical protein [Hymenobacter duratus]MBD2716590.1 hypothetical protein [Hymenobacter duratus]MBR7951505.1 hypothetical protein [Microvirga sp. STR05]